MLEFLLQVKMRKTRVPGEMGLLELGDGLLGMGLDTVRGRRP